MAINPINIAKEAAKGIANKLKKSETPPYFTLFYKNKVLLQICRPLEEIEVRIGIKKCSLKLLDNELRKLGYMIRPAHTQKQHNIYYTYSVYKEEKSTA